MKPVALILSLIALTSCGADKTVSNKELGFEITYPEKWTVTEKTAKPMVAMAVSTQLPGAKSIAGVNVSRYDWDADLEGMASVVNEGLEKTLDGYKEVERSKVKALIYLTQ